MTENSERPSKYSTSKKQKYYMPDEWSADDIRKTVSIGVNVLASISCFVLIMWLIIN